jgi:hypothetical protein
MIITQHITPKDIAMRFGCSVRVIVQLLRARRIPVVDGAVDSAVLVIYAERLHALASPTL